MARTIIQPGDEAPAFEAEAVDGTQVRLCDYRGAPLLPSFYRYVTCPVCNDRIGPGRPHHSPPVPRAVAGGNAGRQEVTTDGDGGPARAARVTALRHPIDKAGRTLRDLASHLR